MGAEPTNEGQSGKSNWWLLLPVFLTSFCTLFLELLYPKIFYFVKVLPGFEMVLVAVNMLGMALGGLFSFYKHGSRPAFFSAIILFPLAVAASFVSCISLTNHLAIIFILTVPFFLAAVIVGQAFILGRPSRVYAASLSGAGLGVLAIFILISPLGGEGCMLAVCAAGSLSALFVVSRPGGKKVFAAGAAMLVLFSGLLVWHLMTDSLNLIRVFPRTFKYPGRTAQVGSDALKLLDADLLASRWSLITRLDIIEVEHSQFQWCFPNGLDHLPDSELLRELDETYWTDINLYYNNEAFTAMARKPEMDGVVPYVLLDEPKVLVIGTGGGTDLAKAFGADAKKVVGVEINPDTVELMKGRFADISGNVYNRADMYTMDGRTYVHMTDEKFDLINLMFAELYIAFPNSQVFIENYLYTAEAFDDYLSHLTDPGILFISKPLVMGDKILMDQMLRILSTAYEALERAGADDPADHIVFISMGCDVDFLHGGQLLVKKTPFTDEEISALRGKMVAPFSILYAPDMEIDEGDNAVADFILSKNKEDFYREYAVDVKPVTDDRPFFYVFDKDYGVHMDFFLMFLVAILLVNLVPLGAVLVATGRVRWKGYPLAIVVFALLGMAYMLTQAVMVQKLNVFLGSPSYSLAVVIGSFLILGAAGSWIAGRIGKQTFTVLLLLIPVAMVLQYLFFPVFVEEFFGSSLSVRVSSALLFICPLAVLLGVPFPRVLERAKEMLGDREAGIFYAVDSAFSVLAVASSIMLSIMLGFDKVFWIAGILYLLTAVFILGWRRTSL